MPERKKLLIVIALPMVCATVMFIAGCSKPHPPAAETEPVKTTANQPAPSASQGNTGMMGNMHSGMSMGNMGGMRESMGGGSMMGQPVGAGSTTAPANWTGKAAILTPAAAKGKVLFAENCASCHGAQGQGVPHLGADLQTSAFVRKLTDAQLVAFIKRGRPADSPASTTHMAMPPFGGNPTLTTTQLYDIVAYIRALQKR